MYVYPGLSYTVLYGFVANSDRNLNPNYTQYYIFNATYHLMHILQNVHILQDSKQKYRIYSDLHSISACFWSPYIPEFFKTGWTT